MAARPAWGRPDGTFVENNTRRPVRKSRWPVIAAVVVAVGLGGYFAYRHYSQSAAAGKAAGAGDAGSPGGFGGPPGAGGGRFGGGNGPQPVKTAAAKTADVGIYLPALGTITPPATATVHSRVDGQLMKVLFREGQAVRAGQLLAVIDPREFQASLAQAEGQMARDQALLKNAQLDLERYKTLFAQDSIAKQQLDTQAALVLQYEGTVKTDQGVVDNARLQLSYTNITAPISGRVGLRQVDLGNIVHASDTSGVVIVTQLQPITAVFTIPQDNISAIMKKWVAGEKLPVEAYDRAQKNLLSKGFLLSVDNQIDTSTGTVKLRAQFDNADGSLFPNQFVNIKLLADTLHGAVTVPVSSVLRGTQGNFVYVLKQDNSVTVRQVTTGPSDGSGQNVSIASGLNAGEVVVTDGTDRLREGAKVTPVDGNAATAAAGGAKGGHHRHEGGGNWKRADGQNPGQAADGTAAGAAPGAAADGQARRHRQEQSQD